MEDGERERRRVKDLEIFFLKGTDVVREELTCLSFSGSFN